MQSGVGAPLLHPGLLGSININFSYNRSGKSVNGAVERMSFVDFHVLSMALF